MSKSIELSPEHGLNPTVSICFWCGEDKGELALLGRIKERDPHTGRAVRGSDLRAPCRMVLDYEPCSHCKEIFDKGVQVIECNKEPVDERPAISTDGDGSPVYPTGRHLVIIPESAQFLFNRNLRAGNKVCTNSETFNNLVSTLPGGKE